jgi:hypothetical protein
MMTAMVRDSPELQVDLSQWAQENKEEVKDIMNLIGKYHPRKSIKFPMELPHKLLRLERCLISSLSFYLS